VLREKAYTENFLRSSCSGYIAVVRLAESFSKKRIARRCGEALISGTKRINLFTPSIMYSDTFLAYFTYLEKIKVVFCHIHSVRVSVNHPFINF
jgi:hypothetical protein